MKLKRLNVDDLPDLERTVLILADDGPDRKAQVAGVLSILLFLFGMGVMFLRAGPDGVILMSAGIVGFGVRSWIKERAAWIRIVRRLDEAST